MKICRHLKKYRETHGTDIWCSNCGSSLYVHTVYTNGNVSGYWQYSQVYLAAVRNTLEGRLLTCKNVTIRK